MSVYAFQNHIHIYEPSRRHPAPHPGPTSAPAHTDPDPSAPYRLYYALLLRLNRVHRYSFSRINFTHTNSWNILNARQRKEEFIYDLHDIWEDTETTYSELLSCVSGLKMRNMPAMTGCDSLLGYEVMTPEILAQVDVEKRRGARREMREVLHEMGKSEVFMDGVRMMVYKVERELFGSSKMWESLEVEREGLWRKVKDNMSAYKDWARKWNS